MRTVLPRLPASKTAANRVFQCLQELRGVGVMRHVLNLARLPIPPLSQNGESRYSSGCPQNIASQNLIQSPSRLQCVAMRCTEWVALPTSRPGQRSAFWSVGIVQTRQLPQRLWHCYTVCGIATDADSDKSFGQIIRTNRSNKLPTPICSRAAVVNRDANGPPWTLLLGSAGVPCGSDPG